jgi:hypothetical protein
MMDPHRVQHINVKVFAEDGQTIDLADAVPVFHRWIRDRVRPDLLIDVADYRHVTSGPGVLLIGHEANYSLDNRENRLGLLYNRKARDGGTLQSRLQHAYVAVMHACNLLEREDCFRGKLRFARGQLEVFVNDRLLAPNTPETLSVLRPEMEKFFPGARIEHIGERRDLFRLKISRPPGHAESSGDG